MNLSTQKGWIPQIGTSSTRKNGRAKGQGGTGVQKKRNKGNKLHLCAGEANGDSGQKRSSTTLDHPAVQDQMGPRRQTGKKFLTRNAQKPAQSRMTEKMKKQTGRPLIVSSHG